MEFLEITEKSRLVYYTAIGVLANMESKDRTKEKMHVALSL